MKRLVLMAVLCLCATLWGQQSGSGKATMSIPGVGGSLELNVGPVVWESRVRSDGKETQLQAMDRPDGLKVTAFLQRVDFAANPEKCRDEWWTATEKGYREHHLKLDQFKKSSQENMARVEFIFPEFQGLPVRMKTVHAYMGARDLCAEIHLSKVRFEPAEQKLFEDLLATARLRIEDSGSQSQKDKKPANEVKK